MRRRWAAAAAVPLLLLTACGPQPSAGNPDPETGTGSMSADEVVLRVSQTGGFVPPSLIASRLPTVTVYGDGRVISEGPITMIYPGPALPNVQERSLSPDQVDALVERAIAAGVGGAPDVGQPAITDNPNTRFTLTTDGTTKELEVYALPETMGLTQAQIRNRKALTDLIESMTTAPGSGEPTAYEPAAVAAIATAWVAPGADAGLVAPEPVAWPGPALPGEPMGAADLGVGCVVAEGDQAAAVLAAASKANAATPWTSGGKKWSVTLRPLLPDETGCADLREQS
jgi:hypothetical protein